MNKISIIEFTLVGVIVLLQIIQALKTREKINILRSMIPSKDFFKVRWVNIPFKDLQDNRAEDVLDNLSDYEKQKSDEIKKPEVVGFDYTHENLKALTIVQIINKIQADFSVKIHSILKDDIIEEALAIHHYFSNQNLEDTEEVVTNETQVLNEISLINPEDECNSIFQGLLQSINVYLLRNKGATTDFNLIKDITERNIDTEDEDISQAITTPLYLGLMGTMLGIIFGLINLFLVSENGKDFEVQGFLIGVSIAMSASFIGLLFTVLNSSYYKQARKSMELAKNDFYTFIQTELLPILNQSVSSSVYLLHTNLVKFNDNFTQNIDRLTCLLNKNYDAVIAQDDILQKLDGIDIMEFAKANAIILTELKAGTEDLHKFNKYLNLLNSSMDGTTRLSNSFQALLNRVNNFENLAEKLDSRVEESNRLVQFLNDHFSVLDERGELINDSVKKVDDVLSKSLVELREHTSEKIDAIKDLTIKEEDLMTKSFADNRSHFSKLSLLTDLNENFKNLQNTFKSEIKGNSEILKSINEQLINSNKISDKSILERFKKWISQKDDSK